MEPFKQYFVYSLQQHGAVDGHSSGPFPVMVERALKYVELERKLVDLVLEAQARGVRDARGRSLAASDPAVERLAGSLGFESATITWVVWDPTTYCRLDVPGLGCVTGHAIRNGEAPNTGRAMTIALHRAVREVFYVAARRALEKSRKLARQQKLEDLKAQREAPMLTGRAVILAAMDVSDGGSEDLDHPIAVELVGTVEEPF